MDLKDYLSLTVSGLALALSWHAIRLTRARDQRDIEKLQPRLDLRLPPLDGVGQWSAIFEIENRSPTPLVLKRILTRGDNKFHLIGDQDGRVMRVNGPVIGPKDFCWLLFDVTVEAGETLVHTLKIASVNGQRIGSAVPTTLYVEFMMSDAGGEVQRLAIRRKANP